jgi:hypothetical protein
MNRLGFLGTIGQKVQQAAAPVTKKPEEAIQVVEVPTVMATPEPKPIELPIVPEPEPEPIQAVELPIVPEPEPEPIQAAIEEQYASLPVLASTVSSHTESFSE